MSGFTCPFCGLVSHNANDMRERYCVRCHLFVDDPWPDPGLAAELPQLSDRTLGLFIRASELALLSYELMVPEGADDIALVQQCRRSLATAIRERQRRQVRLADQTKGDHLE
jgi:hypothetical protein